MNTQCIVYITDKNYIFPTIVSAIQAKQHAQSTTDVLILLSEKVDDFSALETEMQQYSVSLLDYYTVFSDSLSQLDDVGFQGKISKTAMCRLLLHKTLPEQYTQIIYIDGDTQVWNSLADLENYEVPAGRFLASPDYLTIDGYLKGEPLTKYFNSGVLKFNREGWIGQDAFDLYLEKNALKYHDQEVLNIVGEDVLIPMSNRWNYPKQFLSILPDDIQPAIVHFMAHPKPWHGVYFPWDKSANECYLQYRKSSPIFNKYFFDISIARKLAYRYRSIKDTLGGTNQEADKQKLHALFSENFVI